MYLIAAASIAFLVVIVLTRSIGWSRTLFFGVVASLVLLPVGLTPAGDASYGIATSIPQVSTYGVAVSGGAFAALALRSRASRSSQSLFPVGALLFAIHVALGLAIFWDASSAVLSGTLLLLLAIAAWVCGSYLGQLTVGDPDFERWIAAVILGLIAVQCAFSLLQLSGLSLAFLPDQFLSTSTDRIAGTQKHPGTLGKVVFLLLVPQLLLSRSSDRRTRRYAVGSLVIGTLLIAATFGRANLAAVLVMLVLWTLIAPRRNRLGAVLRMSLALLAVVIPLAGGYLARFVADPDGGVRPELLSAAATQIARAPWFGIGPNSYVDTVSRFDAITALTHLPVHNVFLLFVAELGIVGAVLLFTPLALSAAAAIRVRLARKAGTLEASALIAMVAGVAVLAVTGWGLGAASTLILWFLIVALVTARMKESERVAYDPARDSTIDENSVAFRSKGSSTRPGAHR